MGKPRSQNDEEIQNFINIRKALKGQQLTAMQLEGDDIVMQFNAGQSTVIMHGVEGMSLNTHFLN